jgi:DNA-binding transcriptional MerR regulator
VYIYIDRYLQEGMIAMARQFSLRDLVALTGFSGRQIRFYISERLVPGAGDDRGPNASYPQETLDRLKLIARYKAIPLPPADRTMTLEEIRRTLDGMTPEEVASQAAVETRSLAPVGAMRAPELPIEEFCLRSALLREDAEPEPAATEMRPLLRQAERLLLDAARQRAPWRRAPQDAWRCLKTPLIEIHVKEPVDDRERTQLRHLAESLSRTLGEDKP